TSMSAAGREGVVGTPSWGLIAAVLGNSRNRRRFARGAWFRDPTLREAMASGEGTPDWDEARTAFRAALEGERACGERAVDAARAGGDEFWRRPDAERQGHLPWITAEHDRCRAEVFVTAMALHRALAAARPLRENMAHAINLVLGRLDPDAS